jgi:predicted PurR-regulated permease PerM
MATLQSQKFDYLLTIGALFLFSVFVYFLKESLTPLLLFFSVIFLLFPLRKYAFVKHFLFIVTLVFLIWFFKDASQIITPFIISLALAYLFDPLVAKLEQWKIKRWISVLAIVLFVLGILVVLSIVLVPIIIDELTDLVKMSISYSDKAADWLESKSGELLPLVSFDNSKIQEFLITELPGKIQSLLETVFKGALNITSALSTAIGQLLNLVLIPFLFFYLLKDFDKIKNWFFNLIRIDTKYNFKTYATKIDEIISGFFRGQLTVCLIVAVLTSLGLAVFNVKYALIIGITAGVLNIIPYVGLLITLVFSILISLFSPDPLFSIIKVVVIIEIVQIIEGSFLSPKIVGDRVGLHPAWVMFSILILSHLLGFIGLLLAVPIAATIKIFVVEAMHSLPKPEISDNE